jgi:CheY-like chemotaxis protein
MDDCNALIVDDEADIRELIEMTLLPLGVTCLPAETLAMARALLKRHASAFASPTCATGRQRAGTGGAHSESIIPICRWR